jgi:hypothetical protein
VSPAKGAAPPKPKGLGIPTSAPMSGEGMPPSEGMPTPAPSSPSIEVVATPKISIGVSSPDASTVKDAGPAKGGPPPRKSGLGGLSMPVVKDKGVTEGWAE